MRAISKLHLGVGALALLALVSVGIDYARHSGGDRRVGTTLMSASDLASIDRVVVDRGGQSFTLARKAGDRWFVPGTTEFPVNASKMGTFFDAMQQARFERLAAKDAATGGGFGLDAGVKVTLSSKDKTVLAFTLGATRSGGGQYAQVGGDRSVYLLDRELGADGDVGAWELKNLIRLKKGTIKTLEFLPGKGVKGAGAKFAREKDADPFKLDGKGTIKAGEVEGLDTILEDLSFTTRVDVSNEEAKAALSAPSKLVATLFDGRVVTVLVGKIGEGDKARSFAKVEVVMDGAKVDTATKEEMDLLTQRMSQNYFEIASYLATRLTKTRTDMVEP